MTPAACLYLNGFCYKRPLQLAHVFRSSLFLSAISATVARVKCSLTDNMSVYYLPTTFVMGSA